MSPSSPGSKPLREPDRSREAATISEIVGALLAQPVLAQGVKVGNLARSWAEVVGERLAAETAPTRLERGTLTVAASSGPWGVQAKFLAEEIRRRANEVLGDARVDRVVVVVDEGRPTGRKPL